MTARIALYFLLILSFKSNGQATEHMNSKSKLWVSFLVNGTTHEVITYYLTQDSIIVKQGAVWNISENDKITFSSKLDQQQKVNLNTVILKISKTMFKPFYFNPCIVLGTTLEFSLYWNNHIKRATLSNYYLDEVSSLVNFINKGIPKKYAISYDKKKLKGDLKKCSQTQ